MVRDVCIHARGISVYRGIDEMNSRPIVNALSVDVEEYFQVSAFESVIETSQWEKWPPRVEFATGRLLDLFAESGVHATFFTLGWVAERYPLLLRRMVDEGHEVGCHGLQHVRITAQTPEQFREDLKRSKELIEDAAGVMVRGYRAASFSISRANLWAYEEIAAAGFQYSSSVYPVHHDIYGIPEAPRVPFRPPVTPGITEIPISTVKIGSRNLPAGGGGYFRLLPYAISRALIRRVNRIDNVAANMYFHPWEFDPEQPRPTGLPLKSQFRHYINQQRSLPRLRRLLEDFSWGTFAQVYAAAIAGQCDMNAGRELFASS